MDTNRFVRCLTRGLSQTTSNLLAIRLGVSNPSATEAYPISDWPDFSNHLQSDWCWNYSDSNYICESDFNHRFNYKRSCVWENNINNINTCTYYSQSIVPKYQNFDYKTDNTLYW